jgi:hypothetical protein
MSGVLTGAALTALITQCAGPNPPIDLLVRIVMHESGGNPSVTNLNTNGTTDYGLAQINSSNLAWLGETPASILDPCHNIAAETHILRGFSAYATGSPVRGFTLRPPGQSVSYVESMSDPRHRNLSTAASPRLRPHEAARLISLSAK